MTQSDQAAVDERAGNETSDHSEYVSDHRFVVD